MTDYQWSEMHRLIGRIQVAMWAIFAFVALALIGAMGQRANDIKSLKDAAAAQDKALERIEAKLGTAR